MADEKEKTSKAKAIQIATATTNTGQVVLFALLDDGTIQSIRPMADESDWVAVKKVK
jgi:hypothetical protein